MIVIVQEEVKHFRDQLADKPKALEALDAIEECEGYLNDAISLLLMRELGEEPDRGFSDLLEKCRKFVCQEEIREFLESGLISPVIEPLSVSVGVPIGTATALSICVFKIGAKKFCSIS